MVAKDSMIETLHQASLGTVRQPAATFGVGIAAAGQCTGCHIMCSMAEECVMAAA